MLQIAMSALVALAGLFLVITADSDFRLFGHRQPDGFRSEVMVFARR